MRLRFSIFCYVVGLALVLYAGYQWAIQVSIGKPIQVEAKTESASSAVSSVKKVPTPKVPLQRLYQTQPKIGEQIGTLIIPKLQRELPIIQGVDEDELSKGVGHHPDTALPGESDSVLLSGHRNTVFRRLGEVGIGDVMIVKTSAGTFTYKVRDRQIVDANDQHVVVSTYPKATLYVSTCYPLNFIGSAPKRFILIADLIEAQVSRDRR